MPDKMHFIMVLHSHQPIGNFDHVFAMATEKCYRPVMEILHEYPEFHVGLHFSGPLLGWLDKNDPELLELMGQMQKRGQAELLSGAFYEPILPAIPRRDAITQLKMQNRFLQNHFNVTPGGFWLAERIWEPSLPEVVVKAGLNYTIVDDTHFYYAGLSDNDMFGYHLTERGGHTLALFPTNKELRYTIPFKQPHKTVDFLRASFETHGSTCATYGDDSEKFGLWPKTYDLVIKRGWLKSFIESILKESQWLKPTTPGEFMASHLPKGRVYLPTSSYEEMLGWALPWQVARQFEDLREELEHDDSLQKYRRFLRGGLWENFLVKYRESNLMHKKMLFLSEQVSAATPMAFDNVLQAQCNCSYWHGLFGGLYLSHIRHAVHSNLITAENYLQVREFAKDDHVKSTIIDFDLDGREEVLFSSKKYDFAVHPSYGGSISLLNLREPKFNIANTLTRRPEAYHNTIQESLKDARHANGDEKRLDDNSVFSPHDKIMLKEEGLENFLLYDWYERSVFQDHVLPYHNSLEGFSRATFTEWGDFIDQPYQLLEHHPAGGQASCRLERQGNVWSPDGPWPLTVNKTYTMGTGGWLQVDYNIKSENLNTPGFMWGVELNLTLLSDKDEKRFLLIGGKRVEFKDSYISPAMVESFALVNHADNFRVDFSLSEQGTIWSWPVYTVSQSEAGLERTYQGTSLLLLWNLNGMAFEKNYSITMEV